MAILSVRRFQHQNFLEKNLEIKNQYAEVKIKEGSKSTTKRITISFTMINVNWSKSVRFHDAIIAHVILTNM